jgi:hypothetical protein
VKLHPHVAGLVAIADPRWRAKLFRGGLLLCIPVVGWPAVLGYRARFVHHLFAPTPELLPDWREGFWGFVGEGLRAMAVIFGWLWPLYVVAAWLALGRGFTPGAATAWLTLGFVLFPIFATLSFPTMCLLLAGAEHHWLSGTECAVLVAAYALLVFLLPAGFLEVTRTNHYRSAFAIWRTLPFVLNQLGPYCKAWWYSGLMSLCGHFALPLAPWGIVWCYLAIVLLFNELLPGLGETPGEAWLPRALADPRFTDRGRSGRFTVLDEAGQSVTALDLVFFSAPLPRFRVSHGSDGG